MTFKAEHAYSHGDKDYTTYTCQNDGCTYSITLVDGDYPPDCPACLGRECEPAMEREVFFSLAMTFIGKGDTLEEVREDAEKKFDAYYVQNGFEPKDFNVQVRGDD